jgi:hypothetical protein
MRVSEKRSYKLYKAISDPIMQVRVVAHSGASLEEIDKLLFDLDSIIHQKVSEALSLTRAKVTN